GQALISGGIDGTVRLWDPATGRELRRWSAPEPVVFSLALSPDGKSLFSSGYSLIEQRNLEGKAVRQFGARSREVGRASWLSGLAVFPDGTKVLALDQGRLRIWETATGREIERHWVQDTLKNDPVFSPDGRRLATSASLAPFLCLTETATGKELTRFDL